MLAEILVVTRLLGLVTGKQPFEAQVPANVKAVEVVSDGKTLAMLRGKPWQTIIDFGPELEPHEVTAIAYDENGAVVARDTQLVNLARPSAEAVIVLDRHPQSGAVMATVRWQHIASAKPKRIRWTLDRKLVGKGETVTLSISNPTAIHVLQVEVEFRGGSVATKEIVFGGVYYEEMPAELTAVLTHEGVDCFQLDGVVQRPSAIEKPKALVLFVRSSSAGVAQDALRLPAAVSMTARNMMHRPFAIPDAQLRIIWPTSQDLRDKDLAMVHLFYKSQEYDGRWGTHRILTLVGGPDTSAESFADAVAVAAVQAITGGTRRAVVLILGGERDHSRHSAAIVRHYLQTVGVPLRVWSLTGVTPAMKERWGDVLDISSSDLLQRATEELRNELDQQRVAWLPIRPIDALRVVPANDCASR